MSELKRNPFDSEGKQYLDSVRNAPEQPDPSEKEDDALEVIAQKDTELHFDMINLLVLAVVIVFFGSVFLTLTNKQDFSDKEGISIKGLASGSYTAKLQSRFNDSLPLQDYVHNAESVIKYCFGMNNKLDLIDVESKKNADDPYSIEGGDNFTPITESQAGAVDTADPDEVIETKEQDSSSEQEDDGKNKKIESMKIALTTTAKDDSSSGASSTTTNNRSPGATTTTTTEPETTTSRKHTVTVTEEPQTVTEEPKTVTQQTEEPADTSAETPDTSASQTDTPQDESSSPDTDTDTDTDTSEPEKEPEEPEEEP